MSTSPSFSRSSACRAVLALWALLVPLGCGKRIENPAADYSRSNTHPNLLNFGQIIHNPQSSPAAAAPRGLRPVTLPFEVSRSLLQTNRFNQATSADLAQALAPILKPFSDATGITVNVQIREPDAVFSADDFPEVEKTIKQISAAGARDGSPGDRRQQISRFVWERLSAGEKGQLNQGSAQEKRAALAAALSRVINDSARPATVLPAPGASPGPTVNPGGQRPDPALPDGSPTLTRNLLEKVYPGSIAPPRETVLLSPSPEAVGFYGDQRLARLPVSSPDLANVNEIDPFYGDFFRAATAIRDPTATYITNYCLPYEWLLAGLNYDESQTLEVPPSWRILFESPSGREAAPDLQTASATPQLPLPATPPAFAGEVRWLGASVRTLLLGSGIVYLQGKLLRAHELLQEAIDNKAGYSWAPAITQADVEAGIPRAAAGNSTANLAKLAQARSSLQSYLSAESSAGTGDLIAAVESLLDVLVKTDMEGWKRERGLTNLPDMTFPALRAKLRKICGSGQPVGTVVGDMDADVTALVLRPPIEVGRPEAEEQENQLLAAYLTDPQPSASRLQYRNIRLALALVLSYAQYFPDLSSKADLTPGYKRSLTDLCAAYNLLLRQIYRLRMQKELFSDEPSNLLLNASSTVDLALLVQARGPEAAAVSTAQSLTSQRATRRDAADQRNIKFVFPREGSVGTFFHLAVLKGPPDSHDDQQDDLATPEACALINYLLRPDVAGRMSNLSLLATTEPNARAFVDRDILNGPSFAVVRDLTRIKMYDADASASVRNAFVHLGESLRLEFEHMHQQEASFQAARRVVIAYGSPKGSFILPAQPPKFPLGLDFIPPLDVLRN